MAAGHVDKDAMELESIVEVAVEVEHTIVVVVVRLPGLRGSSVDDDEYAVVEDVGEKLVGVVHEILMADRLPCRGCSQWNAWKSRHKLVNRWIVGR